MNVLHIFNGDCAHDAWRAAGHAAPAVIWRENYLEGALPPADTPSAEFAAFRAAELKRMMPDLEVPEDDLRRFLENNDRTLLSAGRETAVYLWFDACMFDQLILARVAFVLRNSPATLYLICEDTVWGNQREAFAERQATARALSPAARAALATGWEAVAGGQAAVEAYLKNFQAADLPFFHAGIRRYAEEFPGADGLGRSERQLCALVKSGIQDFPGIFRAFDRYEKYMFMGDTMCRRMLDRLAARGFLRQKNARYAINA